jgi:hypothetical protein
MQSHAKEILDFKSLLYINKVALPLLEEAVTLFGNEYAESDRPLFLLIALHVNDNAILANLHANGQLSLLVDVMKLWQDVGFIKSALIKLSSELLGADKKKSKRDFFLGFARNEKLLEMDSEGNVIVDWPQGERTKQLPVPASLPYAVAILEPAAYLSLARAGLIPVEWDWYNFGHGRYAHWIQLYILSQAIQQGKISNPLLQDTDSPLKVLLQVITGTELLRNDLKESSTWDLLMDNYFFYTSDLLSKMDKLLKSSSQDSVSQRLQNLGMPGLIERFFSKDNLIHEFHGKINLIMLEEMPELAAKILVSPVKHDFRQGRDWNDAMVAGHLKHYVAQVVSYYGDQWCNPKPSSSRHSFFCISHPEDKQSDVNYDLERLGTFYKNDLLLFKCSSPDDKQAAAQKSDIVKVYVSKDRYRDEEITGETTKGETPFPCYKRGSNTNN